jgi:hypothetical protein
MEGIPHRHEISVMADKDRRSDEELTRYAFRWTHTHPVDDQEGLDDEGVPRPRHTHEVGLSIGTPVPARDAAGRPDRTADLTVRDDAMSLSVEPIASEVVPTAKRLAASVASAAAPQPMRGSRRVGSPAGRGRPRAEMPPSVLRSWRGGAAARSLIPQL